MPSPSFNLDAQLRFHDKWLKIDLQRRPLDPPGLGPCTEADHEEQLIGPLVHHEEQLIGPLVHHEEQLIGPLRAFSPEGLCEMWNEMVKDEEITFTGEESAHTGTPRTEDCSDCFGAQKKDEPNDKEKKEEEETSTSVHHSIIETWDWGRQPGERHLLDLFLITV
ncbi:E3 ubiquitin-protein ligase HERC2 [Liparis tanakae]|uniref:E3 ubiquitin-protein ligase HERC2 n=1 Tax=Liparis tanakae TaxID=230148 RepID=A0A4Z2F6A4_9TELE|nr:E3 ubiquitin-protein ligase HERC2 [Liparis tanakae]